MVPALFLPSAFAASGPSDPQADYAAAYMLELSGADLPEVVRAYRSVAADAGTNRPLAARAWWRIGVCERLQEHWAASREAWRKVVSDYPESGAIAENARTELRDLERALERVSIDGRVVDAEGRPVPQAFLLIGDWVSDVPVLSDKDGQFRVERRAMQTSPSSPRYVFLYAEHPQREQAMLQALPLASRSATGIVVRLQPTVAITGHVGDPAGRPLDGVRISLQATDPLNGISLPYGSVLPPGVSDSNGVFVLENVIEGLPIRLVAERARYRTGAAALAASRTRVQSVELALSPSGRVGMEGVVTDERGQPLDAAVSAYSFTSEESLIATVRTDLNGRYRFSELPDSPMTVLAEAAGYGERRISGVRPGYRRMDFVLGRLLARATRAVATGDPLPAFDVMPLNAASLTAGSLRHHAALLYFWSRPRPVNPPGLLEEFQRRYSDTGMRVVCLHDASALPEDLATTTLRQGISYVVAIDRYAPVGGTGVTQSATFDAFGAHAGDAVAVDAQGLIAWRGRLHDPAAQAQLESVLAELVTESSPEDPGGPRRLVPAGSVAPSLRVRWVRGQPVSGAAPREEDLRGRVVVYHFGSAFGEVTRRDNANTEGSALQLWPRVFAREPVVCIWILPSGEASDDATQAALAIAPDALMAVDIDGATYRAFSAGESGGNAVADPEGRVRGAGLRDEQVFGVVKRLLSRYNGSAR